VSAPNALVIWIDHETGDLRAAPTDVLWCYPPGGSGHGSELGIVRDGVEVFDGLTPREAEAMVRELASRQTRRRA
jgi:hypothetical protein